MSFFYLHDANSVILAVCCWKLLVSFTAPTCSQNILYIVKFLCIWFVATQPHYLAFTNKMPHSSVTDLPACSTVAKRRHFHCIRQPTAKQTQDNGPEQTVHHYLTIPFIASLSNLIKCSLQLPSLLKDVRWVHLVNLRGCRDCFTLSKYAVGALWVWGFYTPPFRKQVNMVGTQSCILVSVMRTH